MSNWSTFRKLLPGGKYYNLELSKQLLAFREDLGPIVGIKAYMGRSASVITHNPQDFEKVFRNEGIWPVRPGSEGQQYHRTVHRADFFGGVTGLVSV